MQLDAQERAMTLRALRMPAEAYVKVGRDRERQLIAEAERVAARCARTEAHLSRVRTQQEVEAYGAWRAEVRGRLAPRRGGLDD